MRSLDQSRDIGEHEIAPRHRDDAEGGMQRSEGIGGNLGPGGADGGEKGRLARIGQADQPGVGDELEA